MEQSVDEICEAIDVMHEAMRDIAGMTEAHGDEAFILFLFALSEPEKNHIFVRGDVTRRLLNSELYKLDGYEEAGRARHKLFSCASDIANLCIRGFDAAERILPIAPEEDRSFFESLPQLYQGALDLVFPTLRIFAICLLDTQTSIDRKSKGHPLSVIKAAREKMPGYVEPPLEKMLFNYRVATDETDEIFNSYDRLENARIVQTPFEFGIPHKYKALGTAKALKKGDEIHNVRKRGVTQLLLREVIFTGEILTKGEIKEALTNDHSKTEIYGGEFGMDEKTWRNIFENLGIQELDTSKPGPKPHSRKTSGKKRR